MNIKLNNSKRSIKLNSSNERLSTCLIHSKTFFTVFKMSQGSTKCLRGVCTPQGSTGGCLFIYFIYILERLWHNARNEGEILCFFVFFVVWPFWHNNFFFSSFFFQIFFLKWPKFKDFLIIICVWRYSF